MSAREDNSERVLKHPRKCFSFKYRIRWFHSKGAALVLLWTFLFSTSTWYLFKVNPVLFSGLNNTGSNGNSFWIYEGIVCGFFLVCAPFLGWLADARLGNYKLFKTGSVFVFFASVVACVGVMFLENLTKNNNLLSIIGSVVIVTMVYFFTCVGSAACLVTSLQLGLDQMPDASTANITSFISWFVCGVFTGVWTRDVLFRIFPYCFGQVACSDNNCTVFHQIFSLFPVLCMTIVLCSDFFLSPKWLIIEPKSSQSLKVIFQVLKFTKKHKAPISRSAFTYWEEDIPSRIDFGKSKYGGPFTTEQVEDVKTIFKLLVVYVPFFKILVSIFLLGETFTSTGNDNILSYFTYNGFWCVSIGTLVYEFVIYPFARNKLPSILKRIGIASFLIVIVSVVSLIVSVVSHFESSVDSFWLDNILDVVTGLSSMVLLSAAFEFVCAQSPYNMRTLVTGYATMSFFFPIGMGTILHTIINNFCTDSYCFIIRCSISTALGIVGFFLHCILAHWYKRRVRDDIYHPQRWVEDVYSRYLSAQT